METSLVAPFRGRVRQVLVEPERPRGAPTRRCCSSSRSTRRRRDAGAGERISFAALQTVPPVRRSAAARTSSGSSGPCSATTSTPPRWSGSSPTCMASARTCWPMRSRPRPGRAPPARAVRGPPCARPAAPGRSRAPTASWVRSPQEHLHAFLRSLDAKAEGLPELPEAAAPGAAPLRHREPRPHPGAGGGVLPAVPRPAARRGARRAPCSRSSTAGSSRRHARRRGRSRLPRGARPAGRGDRRPRPGDRRPRAPGAVRATSTTPRDRAPPARGLRGGGRPTSMRWRTTRARADRDARHRRPRRLPAAARPDPDAPDDRRAAAGRWARAARGDGAPLSTGCATLERVRRDDIDGHRLSPRATRHDGTPPAARRRRSSTSRARRRRARGRRGPRRCPPASRPSPTSTREYAGTAAGRRAGRACSPASPLPPGVHRDRRGRGRAGDADRGMSADGRRSPSAPATTAWSRTGAARTASDDGAPPAAWRAVGVRARAPAVGRGRLRVSRRRPATNPTTSACSRWPRCAT